VDAAGLYIHVPFCTAICPYCDYAVLIAGEERRAGYVAALLEEMELAGSDRWRFDTVYLGGGTPSALATTRLAQVVGAVRARMALTDDVRLHLEVNPEDVTVEAARAWRELGVGFVSLGVQSLDDGALRFLGRAHGARRARQAFQVLREVGFDTVSIDLMYGFEGQDAAGWQDQLEAAAALAPDHLSCYQLTFHQGTVFGRRLARGVLAELDPEIQAELFRLTHRRLADLGYEAYEVSSFAAREAHRSRHNLKYWTHAPYLGLGPSAHSFDGSSRWWNLAKLRLWQTALERGQRPLAGEEALSPSELALESVMLGLRITEGIDLARLRARCGVDLVASNRALVERLCDSGLVVVEGDRLRPTLEGLAVADSLAREFELSE